MKPYSFLFGTEKPGFTGFFRTALFRVALFYPAAVLISNSAADVFDLVLILLWLLGGNWKSRIGTIRNSPILVVTVLLSALSFIGALQFEPTEGVSYGESLFRSLKYWRGHHPLPIIIVLATILTTRSQRTQLLGGMSATLLLTLFYSVLNIHILTPNDLTGFPKLIIAKNTIWFGMAFVILAGLWLCCPYMLRLNPFLRKRLPAKIRSAMRTVSGMSFADFSTSLIRPSGCSKSVHLFNLFRWGIVGSCLVYIVLINTSRTGYLAILFGISVLLLLWNKKTGLVIIMLFSVLLFSLAHFTSDAFNRKAKSVVREIQVFASFLKEDKNVASNKNKRRRLDLYWHMSGEIMREPLGVGMLRTQEKCLQFSGRFDNTHSEFLAIGSQIGVPGLILFCIWLYLIFHRSRKLEPPWKQLGLYTVTVLLVDCLFNGALSQDMEGHLFSILIAVIASIDAETRQRAASASATTGRSSL